MLLKESASQGAPSEAGARLPLSLPAVLSVLEASCPWQRGKGREKAVKSRFDICLDLHRPSQAPAAGCVTPLLDRGVSRSISVQLRAPKLSWRAVNSKGFTHTLFKSYLPTVF